MCSHLISCSSPAFATNPLPLTLSCVGGGGVGGDSQVFGVSPHLLYQAAHEGHARLLGGSPPLSFGLDVAPPPSTPCTCMPCAGGTRCLGGPLVVISGFGAPPLPCMPCAESALCSGGTPSSFSWLGGFPSSRSGMPCAGSAHCRSGGSAPSTGLGLHTVGPCGPSPTPSCPRAVCVHCWGWGWGPPSLSWDLSRGGDLCWYELGSPPCPYYAPWARAAGLGVPLPLPLLGGRSR